MRKKKKKKKRTTASAALGYARAESPRGKGRPVAIPLQKSIDHPRFESRSYQELAFTF